MAGVLLLVSACSSSSDEADRSTSTGPTDREGSATPDGDAGADTDAGPESEPSSDDADPPGEGPAELLSPEAFAELIEDPDLPVINVHIPYEGEIAGTDDFFPFDRVEEWADELPDDKDAPIVLYCMSGRMSGIASEALAALGYTDLYDLDGGMEAWQAAGFELAVVGP